MTPELLALLGSIVGGTGALLSYWAGWRARGAQRPPRGSYGRCLDPDWRRSFNHENTNWPSGPSPLNLRRSEPVRMDEGRTVRGNGNGGPTTPKPLIVTVQGLSWPPTLGDFTLVGPADNAGAWRWYERHHDDGTIERIKVDHQLQPIKPMSTDLSVTPSPELVAKLWTKASAGRDDAPIGEIFNHGVYLAYAAGADQELEACCEWLDYNCPSVGVHDFRAARRPKPPSLKEQALEQLGCIQTNLNKFGMGISTDTILAALETLPND